MTAQPAENGPRTALPGKKVALVHEWFSAHGGSENVFMDIADVFPQARRYALWKEPDAAEEFALTESWLSRTPLRRSKSLALPLMPLALRTLPAFEADVVISSSHAFAHTVKIKGATNARYLSYVHSPARYVWSPHLDGRGASRLLAVPRIAMQRADLRLGRHVHSYAANSVEVQRRIQRYWGRDAYVINPPVDVEYFQTPPSASAGSSRDYLLAMGRWVSYKNFDLAIAVADAARTPIVVAGSGPEEERLRRLAATMSVPVTFEVRPSRERLRELFWGALGLVFPAHEDFGIIPVEAQASGTPVLGLRRGGLLESVADGSTGFLVDALDPQAYAPFVRRLAELDPALIQKQARNFSREIFQTRIREWAEHEAG